MAVKNKIASQVDERQVVSDDLVESEFDEIEYDLSGRTVAVNDMGLIGRAVAKQKLVAIHAEVFPVYRLSADVSRRWALDGRSLN